MKRKHFMIAAAVLTMTACSTDETVEVNRGNAITFNTVVDTRAEEKTQDNLTEFFVTALYDGVFLDNTCFEFDSESSSYVGKGGDVFWPKNNYSDNDGSNTTKVDFYVYYPSAESFKAESSSDDDNIGEIDINTTNSEIKLKNFTPALNISNQVDFVSGVALQQTSTTKEGCVNLTLEHNLAQIEVKAKNTNSNFTYRVLGVQIGGIITGAEFDFKTGEWSNNDLKEYDDPDVGGYQNTTTCQGLLDNPIMLGENAVSIMPKENDNAMVVPQEHYPEMQVPNPKNPGVVAMSNGSFIGVLVNITSGDKQIFPQTEGNYQWVMLPLGNEDKTMTTKWEAGKKYVYTLDFSNGAGLVTGDTNEYNPEDLTEPIEPEEPYSPADPIMNSTSISFKVTMTNWDSKVMDDNNMGNIDF